MGKQTIEELEAQVKQLAAENVSIKAMNDCLSEELRGYESDGAFEGPKMHLLWWQVETPATDAILASLRAEAITDALENGSGYLDTDCVMDRHDISYQDAELRAAGAMELRDSLVAGAKQLRSKSEVQS